MLEYGAITSFMIRFHDRKSGTEMLPPLASFKTKGAASRSENGHTESGGTPDSPQGDIGVPGNPVSTKAKPRNW
jgi:hypothetical protein